MSLASRLPYDHAFAGGFSGIGSQPLPTDADAIDYLSRMATADGAGVETGVAVAVDAFIRDAKELGVFSALKACCILAGARTLAGALVPVVGDAPTNVADGFVEGDYSRTAGLTGDGATTYLDSGRNNNADPQNSVHHSIWVSAQGSAVSVPIGAGFNLTGATRCAVSFGTSVVTPRIREAAPQPGISDAPLSGSFFGYRRSAAAASLIRINGSDYARTTTSEVPFDGNVFVFADNNNGNLAGYTDATLAFYSIGTSLSLADLDTAVTNLLTRMKFALLTGENPAPYDIDTLDYVVRGYENGGTLE